MKKEIIDNKCMRCKYGDKIYVRISGAFMPVKCVGCTCAVVDAREAKRRIKNKEKCNFFELDETEINPLREILGYRLVKMADEINEIATVLKRMDKRDD